MTGKWGKKQLSGSFSLIYSLFDLFLEGAGVCGRSRRICSSMSVIRPLQTIVCDYYFALCLALLWSSSPNSSLPSPLFSLCSLTLSDSSSRSLVTTTKRHPLSHKGSIKIPFYGWITLMSYSTGVCGHKDIHQHVKMVLNSHLEWFD